MKREHITPGLKTKDTESFGVFLFFMMTPLV